MRLEPLENRQLLAVVQWIGGSGDWNVGANWSNGLGPGTEDDVVIDVVGEVTVTHSAGEHTVASITANDQFSLTGGVLRVNGNLGGNGPIRFAGGTLENATIDVGTAVINSSSDSKILKNATILGTFDMATFSSNLSIEGELALNGEFLVGNPNGDLGASGVITRADASVTGTGSLVFGGSLSNTFSCLGIGLTTEIGAGITVRGAGGRLGSSFCPVLNHGSIHVDTLGDGLTVHFADTGFASTGTLRVSAGTLTVDGNWAAGSTEITGGTLNLKGDFATSSLGTFSRGANGTAGTVNVLGTLRNGLTLNDTYGSWFLKGGTLLGGVLDVAPGSSAELISTDFGGTISGVDIQGGLDLETPFAFGTSVLFKNHTTLNQTLRMNGTRLSVDGELNGSGTIFFGDSTSTVTCGFDFSMTLGPSITVRGQAGSVGGFNCSLVNQGTIHADTIGGRLNVDFADTTVPSLGTLRVSAGDMVITGNNWHSGLTEVLGGTLQLGTIPQPGTITQQSLSTVRRGGNGTAGRINLYATVTGGLRLDDNLGSMFLQYGRLVGGTLDVAPGSHAQLIATDSWGTLSGVNIRGGLNMEANYPGFGGTGVMLNNQSTLDQTLQLGAVNGEGASRIFIDGTLNGTGTIVFGNSAGNAVSCSQNLVMAIGPSITIRGSHGNVSYTGCNTDMQGTIQAESGGTIHVGSVTNYANGVLTGGTWKALDGSTLRLDGAQITSIAAKVELDGVGSRIIRNIAADSALTNLATIAPGGALALRHGVDHSTVGSFSNDGILSVGPDSTLSVNGALALGAASTLSLEIGGHPDSGDFGHIVTSGNAALAGTLEVRLTDGYGPTSGLTYSSMTFGERAGDFATKALSLGDVPMFTTSYSSTSLLVSTITNAPNLAFNSVQPPSSVHVGDLIAIPFSVTNVSGTAAPGGWHDAVYLSLDNTLGPEDIRLGAVQRVTPLAGNATIAGVLTAPIPRMPTGTYHVLVVADDEAMIPDLSRADNVGLSPGTIEVSIETNPVVLSQKTLGFFATGLSIDRWTFTGMAGQQVRLDTIATAPNKALYTLTGPSGFTGFSDLSTDSEFIDLPHTGPYTLEVRSASGVGSSNYSFQLNETSQTLLPLETDYVGNLAGTGMAQMFQVTLPGTDPLQIRFDGSVSADNVEVYAKFGSPPNRQSFDVRNSLVGADHVLQVPVGVPGKLFVLVYAQQVAATMPFTLRVDRTEVIVGDVSPAFIAAGVPQAVTVSGLGFTPGSIVELIPTGGGSPILGSSVKILSADKLSAVFTLPQATAGTFDARVTLPNGASNTLQAGVIVQPGQAKLETRIIATLVPCCGTATLYVEYANTGTTTMPAPILTLSSADPANPADTERPYFSLDQSIVVEGFWTSAIPDGFSDTVEFLASGESIGWLQPGERMLMPVYYIGMQPPREIFDGFFDLAVGSVEAGDPTPIPWAELEAELRPSSISIEAWPTIFDNLQAQMGSTLGDYHQTILDNAVYLGRLGQRVADAAQLLGFELQQAIGIDYVGPIATAVDASVPAPGLSLEFPRSFGNSIAEHYQIGPFGRGWTSDWHRSLETLTDGTIVFHQSADIQRRFQPDRRTAGAYLSETGITVKLRKLSSGLYELIKANGEVTRFHPDGRLDQVRDANGNTITAGYAGNQLIGLTHSSGDALSIEHNDAGRIASVTDSRGRVTSYTYDASNTHLMSVTDVRGTATYQYSLGQGAAREHALTSVTDSTGVERLFEYDASGRLAATSLANDVERITFSYDSAGQVTRTAQDGVQTSLYFDSFGLLARVEDSSGFYVNAQYDNEFRSVQLTDALGRSESSEFTKTGGLQTIVDANYQETLFTPGGPRTQFTSFADANGNVTNYTFDTAGNLTGTVYADTSLEQTTYDAQGNPDLITNRRGQVVDVDFNSAGQITRQLYADGTSADFTYDARGRLATATDGRGVTTFSYDSADRLTRVEYPGARWLDYQYDATGRRTRLEDHTGHITQYAYDAAGRLQTVRGPANALLVQYTYDAAGRVAREDKGNGTFTEYVYDTVGRTTSITHRTPGGTVSAKIDYSYDLSGRVSTMTTPDGMWTYSYDLTDQLVRAVFASTNAAIAHQDLSYEYDALGNRVRTIVNGATTDYSTNGMNQIVSAGATTYTYDLDGNLTQESGPGGTRQYTYDSRNRLTGAQTPEGVWQYEYDVLGNRSAVIMNGQRTEYLIDPTGLGEVAAEFSPSGTLNARYSRGLGLVGREDENGAASFYNFDSLGSTVQLTGAAGAIQNTYAYQPFGEALHATGAASNPFTFVGALGVMQEGNGLYFMRARFYSPTQGRFTQQDPIRLNGRDTNLYRYVDNEPTAFVDPRGLMRIDVDIDTSHKDAFIQADVDFRRPPKNICTFSDDIIEEEIYRHHFRYLFAPILFPNDWKPPAHDCRGAKLPPAKRTFFKGPVYNVIACRNPDITMQPMNCFPSPVRIVTSLDPNEKFGASGFGPQAFIDGQASIPYSVHFENLGPGSEPTPTQPATAPAQRIEITDQLSTHLDWNTFEFREFGFGDTVISVQATNYNFTAVPVTQNGHDFVVEVELTFDATTGRIRVVFQAIDPATSLPPGALLGILPPEDGSGNGQGYFNYQVRPKAGLATGTEIRNIALITFDANAAIATNQIDPQNPAKGFDPAKEALNTIDAAAPTSSVNALPAETHKRSFSVTWSGQDDASGSGVATYDVYVSVDSGPFTLWLTGVTQSNATFDGQRGRTYAFYSIAHDNVGRMEEAPTSHDTQTTVPPLLGDLDNDGSIGLGDLAILQPRMGSTEFTGSANGDFNGDGMIDRADAAFFASLFGRSESAPGSPPAPAAAAIAAARRAKEDPPRRQGVLAAARQPTARSLVSLSARRRAAAVDAAIAGSEGAGISTSTITNSLPMARRPRRY